MHRNISKSQKTSGSLGNLDVNYWENKGNKRIETRIWTGTLHLVSVTFKDQTEVLLELRSEVNPMNLAVASYLNLKIWKTNVGA